MDMSCGIIFKDKDIENVIETKLVCSIGGSFKQFLAKPNFNVSVFFLSLKTVPFTSCLVYVIVLLWSLAKGHQSPSLQSCSPSELIKAGHLSNQVTNDNQ